MNKKEANEIKKSFTPAGYAITHICGCYVDVERNRKTELKEAPFSLQEEEAFKYFTMSRDAFSGAIEKNLTNMEFPLHTEVEGDTQHSLLELRDSQLKDNAILEEFYDKVIAAYDYGEGYYIILIHCAYNIPARTTDGTEMFDVSDYIYEFIQYTICPVKLPKAGLYHNSLANTIEDRDRDWLVKAPVQGFLFSVLNDGSTDIHSLLYYAKSPEELPDILVDELLGCTIPMSAKSQEGTFQATVEETLGEDCDFGTVRNIRENPSELVEETEDEPVPLILDKYQVKRLLETNGATPGELEESKQRCV